MTKEYLGDGVYAEWVYAEWEDMDTLVLTTENGYRKISNTIYLDGTIIQALLDNIKRKNAEGGTP